MMMMIMTNTSTTTTTTIMMNTTTTALNSTNTKRCRRKRIQGNNNNNNIMTSCCSLMSSSLSSLFMFLLLTLMLLTIITTTTTTTASLSSSRNHNNIHKEQQQQMIQQYQQQQHSQYQQQTERQRRILKKQQNQNQQQQQQQQEGLVQFITTENDATSNVEVPPSMNDLTGIINGYYNPTSNAAPVPSIFIPIPTATAPPIITTLSPTLTPIITPIATTNSPVVSPVIIAPPVDNSDFTPSNDPYVQCNICRYDCYVITYIDSVIPAGMLSFIDEPVNCITFQFQSMNSLYTKSECHEIQSSLVPKLCGCNPDNTIETTSPTTSPVISTTTLSPTTLAPVVTTLLPTMMQTTLSPTTLRPTTLRPTTLRPITLLPTNSSSSTEQPTNIPSTLLPTIMNITTTLSPTTLSPKTLDPTSTSLKSPTAIPSTADVQLPPPPPPVGTSPTPTTSTVDFILNDMSQLIPTDENSITVALYEEMITSFLQNSLLTMNTSDVSIQNIQTLFITQNTNSSSTSSTLFPLSTTMNIKCNILSSSDTTATSTTRSSLRTGNRRNQDLSLSEWWYDMIQYMILDNEQSFIQELQLIDSTLFNNVQTVSVVSDDTSTSTSLAPAIAPATAPVIAPNNSPTATNTNSDDNGLSKGSIIGIVIAATIGLIGAVILFGQYQQSNKKNKDGNGNRIYPMSKIRIPSNMTLTNSSTNKDHSMDKDHKGGDDNDEDDIDDLDDIDLEDIDEANDAYDVSLAFGYSFRHHNNSNKKQNLAIQNTDSVSTMSNMTGASSQQTKKANNINRWYPSLLNIFSSSKNNDNDVNAMMKDTHKKMLLIKTGNSNNSNSSSTHEMRNIATTQKNSNRSSNNRGKKSWNSRSPESMDMSMFQQSFTSTTSNYWDQQDSTTFHLSNNNNDLNMMMSGDNEEDYNIDISNNNEFSTNNDYNDMDDDEQYNNSRDAIITENYVGMKSSSSILQRSQQELQKSKSKMVSSSRTVQDVKEEVSENDNDGDVLNQFRKRGSIIRKQLQSFHIEDDEFVEQIIERKNTSRNALTLEPDADAEYDGHMDPYDSNAYTTNTDNDNNSDVDSRYSSSSDNNDNDSSSNRQLQGSSSVEAVVIRRNTMNSSSNSMIFTRPPSVKEMLSPSHHSTSTTNNNNIMTQQQQQQKSSSSVALLKGGDNNDDGVLHSSSSRYSSSSFELQRIKSDPPEINSNVVVQDAVLVATNQDNDDHYHSGEDELSLHSALQPMHDETAVAVGTIPADSEHSIHYAYSLQRDSQSIREEGKNRSRSTGSGGISFDQVTSSHNINSNSGTISLTRQVGRRGGGGSSSGGVQTLSYASKSLTESTLSQELSEEYDDNDDDNDTEDIDNVSVDASQTTSGSDSSLISRHIKAPPGKLGIVIDTTIEGPVVHTVHTTSPLYNIIYPGDLIIAINGIDTKAMNSSAITALMIRTAHAERTLTILHIDDATSFADDSNDFLNHNNNTSMNSSSQMNA